MLGIEVNEYSKEANWEIQVGDSVVEIGDKHDPAGTKWCACTPPRGA